MNQDGISFCISTQWEETTHMQTSTAIHMSQHHTLYWSGLRIQDISGKEIYYWIMAVELEIDEKGD